MTTALDLIKRALRLDGVYAVGETLSSDEANDSLQALNALVDSLSTSSLMIFAESLDTVPLVANQGTYNIGPTGTDLVTTRPVKVLQSSTITYQGVDYPLTIWTLQDYNSIVIKDIGGTPGVLYPYMTFPDMDVSLWPVPSDTMTLNLWSEKQITSFPALTTVVSLPPGWEQMLAFLLAEMLAPEFDVQVPQGVAIEATRIRRAIKRTNTKVPLMQMPYGIPDNNTWADWRSN